MSRTDQITGTGSQKGKKITLIWGVKYRSIRHRLPNLRKTTLLVNGVATQMRITAGTLKSVKQGKIKGYAYPNYINKEAKVEVKPETKPATKKA